MFEYFMPDVNFNYQMNRVLSFGEAGCDRREVLEAMKQVTDNDSWYTAWRSLAEQAEGEARYLHSMYYYRMAEFMLLADNPERQRMYDKMQAMFAKAFPGVVQEEVPFKAGYLPAVRIKVPNATQTLVIHGGFDSFIEEFYLLAQDFAAEGIDVILFEGEGQGETLQQGMHFNEAWENSVGAVLDHYELDDVILMGISWGGYLALRAAAYDKRIKHVICHGVMYNALDVQTSFMKQPVRGLFNLLYRLKQQKLINLFTHRKMERDALANWSITHGMFITGTETPYDYFQAIAKHHLREQLTQIDQHVLLLTGEKDHYTFALAI